MLETISKSLTEGHFKDQFKKLGLPTKRWEDWKYTSIDEELSAAHAPYESLYTDFDPSILGDLSSLHRVVFIDGAPISSLFKLPKTIQPIEEAPSHFWGTKNKDPFFHWNLASSSSELILKVQDNSTIHSPLLCVFLTTELGKNKINTPRLGVIGGKSSRFNLIDLSLSPALNNFSYTTNRVIQLKLEKEATAKHVSLQMEGPKALSISQFIGHANRDSSLTHLSISLGSKKSRVNQQLHLDKEGAHGEIHALLPLQNEQHGDIFSEIHHHAAHTTSSQLVKSLLADNSHGVFTGFVHVERNAQQINANQLNKNILLSKKAQISTRPQLAVFADDVKCAHGATIGQMDPEEIFYLTSRAIKKDRAIEILNAGFCQDVILKLQDSGLESLLWPFIKNHLPKGGEL